MKHKNKVNVKLQIEKDEYIKQNSKHYNL
jgi:hypothetical protein